MPASMPTRDDAAALTLATREVMDARSAHRGDWPDTIEIEEIEATLLDGDFVILMRYADTRYPDLDLGARLKVGPTFCTDTGLDAEWAASHAAIYFGEATFAGTDPSSWEADRDGTRWYRDTMR